MNKKYILFFLFGLLSITISAQSLAEAKALYEKGEYEEAKPPSKNSSRHNLAMEITTYGTVYVAWKPANPQKP